MVQLGLPAERVGLLLWAAPVGVAVGQLLVARTVPASRWAGLVLPGAVLTLVAPLLLLARPDSAPAAALLALSGAGYACGLGLGTRLIAATPQALRGRTYGLASAGLMFFQGLGSQSRGRSASCCRPRRQDHSSPA